MLYEKRYKILGYVENNAYICIINLNTYNMENIIYALACPVTEKIHYVGKSTQGMRRPMEHLSNSHSKKIREWVSDLKELNHKPIISVLEEVSDTDNILDREKYWVQNLIRSGAVLLNEHLVKPVTIDPSILERVEGQSTDFEKIGKFVKERRKNTRLTQEEFASKTAIALTVIRKIEQGHSNIALNSLLEVLSMFGCTIDIKKITD